MTFCGVGTGVYGVGCVADVLKVRDDEGGAGVNRAGGRAARARLRTSKTRPYSCLRCGLRSLPGAEEFGERDLGKDCQLSCERAWGVVGGLLREAGEGGGGEWHGVDVGVVGVGIFTVGGGLLASEVQERIPEAARAEESFACCIRAMEANGVAWRSAGGLEDYLGAILLAERAGGIGVGIAAEERREFGCGGVDCVPPVAVGIEDDCAGAEDLLDAVGIFSCDADDHVDEFGGAEDLANERADTDELGVVFGIFHGDLGGEWHGDTVSEKIFAGDGKWTRRGIEILCRAYGACDSFRGRRNERPTTMGGVVVATHFKCGRNGAGSGVGGAGAS
jgi:hypothetical protein